MASKDHGEVETHLRVREADTPSSSGNSVDGNRSEPGSLIDQLH